MNERQTLIIKMISEEHSVKVEQLAKRFAVSAETIRRDLKYLEEQELLKRIHGGAVRDTLRSKEAGHEERSNRNMREKIILGRLAADFVEDGDTLSIGNGTTMLEMTKALSCKKNLTIITNSLEVGAEAVQNETNSVYIIGGLLRKNGMSVSGAMSNRFVEEFRVDKCIFSVGGINSEQVVTDYHVEESALVQSMFRIASKKIGLMDYSKLNNTSFKKICNVKDLDILLVDWNVPIKEQMVYRKAGVRVVAARHPDGYGGRPDSWNVE